LHVDRNRESALVARQNDMDPVGDYVADVEQLQGALV
jgi:hypothetical protein